MRMSATRRSDVEAALAGTPVRVVAAQPDLSYGGHWHYARYFLGR
jgi:hypothetical protein